MKEIVKITKFPNMIHRTSLVIASTTPPLAEISGKMLKINYPTYKFNGCISGFPTIITNKIDSYISIIIRVPND